MSAARQFAKAEGAEKETSREAEMVTPVNENLGKRLTRLERMKRKVR